MSKGGLLLLCLELKFLLEFLDLLLLLVNVLVHFHQLSISFEFFLFQNQVVLLNLVKNFFSLNFPFLIVESELANFLNMVVLHNLGIFNLLFKLLKVRLRLLNFVGMLIVVLLFIKL